MAVSDRQYGILDPNDRNAQLIHSGTSNAATPIRRTGEVSGAAHSHVTGGTVNVDLVVGDLVNTQDQPYAVQVDDSGAGTTIVGESDIPGTTGAATWRIKKVIDTAGAGTETTITWADGDSNFDNIWTARGTMVFS